jgi:hypothetical protein
VEKGGLDGPASRDFVRRVNRWEKQQGPSTQARRVVFGKRNLLLAFAQDDGAFFTKFH